MPISRRPRPGPGPLRSLPVFVAGLLAGACASERPALTPEREARVVEVGRRAAGVLVAELGPRLQAHVAEEGPAGALAYCAAEAQDLTRRAQEDLGAGIEVKRTSFRYRNPANAPDSLEAAALERFQTAVEAGDSLPDHLVQVAGEEAYRYYRPLVVGPVCVRCHGPADSLNREVRALLRERYPQDRATGYRVGDFRGVIRVTVPAATVGSAPRGR